MAGSQASEQRESSPIVEDNADSAQRLSRDSERTKVRYEEASKLLEETIKERGGHVQLWDISSLMGDTQNWSNSQFSNKIDAVLEKQRIMVKDPSLLEKCENAIQCFFAAFSPFARNVLKIGAESQSVHNFFLID